MKLTKITYNSQPLTKGSVSMSRKFKASVAKTQKFDFLTVQLAPAGIQCQYRMEDNKW